MCHQYGISALASQTSFRGESSGRFTKCQLFSQARVTRTDDVDVIKEMSVIAVDFYDFLLSKRIFQWANTAEWGWGERAENVSEKFSTRSRRFEEFLVHFFQLCERQHLCASCLTLLMFIWLGSWEYPLEAQFCYNRQHTV